MKKINWGVLGSAKIARQHVIPAINKSKNSRLYAIASRNAKKSKIIASKFSFKVSYDSYRKLLKDKNVDVVYNPLPNHLHLQTSIEACKNKKHVLIEKPITLKSAEVDKLIQVAKKYKVIVKEAFMVRHHAQWQWIKDYINKGRLGDVKAISTYFSFFNSDPKNIRNIKKFGGGVIYDICCYPVLISRYLLGSEPKRVVATSVIDKKFKTDILSTSILDFNGVFSSFTCSTQANYSQQVVILGSKKTLVVENPFNPKPHKKASIVIYKGSSIYRKDNVIKYFPPTDQYSNQVTNFSNHLLKKTKIDFGLEDSKKNMKVVDAIFESLKKNKWVSV